jgi:hypothetical protein
MVSSSIMQLLRSKPLCILSLAAIVCLSGCVADDEVDKATAQFTQNSTLLTHAYQTFMTNANTVEANSYMDNQVFYFDPKATAVDKLPFHPAGINDSGIRQSELLTTQEIALRTTLIKALSDYTSALATLAANKPATKVQTDFATVNKDLKTLTTSATTAFDAPAKGAKAPNFADPVSYAVTGIAAVVAVIQNHEDAAAIRASIKQNDAKIAPLFAELELETTGFFDRSTTAVHGTHIMLLSAYETARTAPSVNQADLLQITDALKQNAKDEATGAASDPTKAIKAFEDAHAELVKLVTDPQVDKKAALDRLIAEMKSFDAEVKTPSKSSTSGSPTTPATPASGSN